MNIINAVTKDNSSKYFVALFIVFNIRSWLLLRLDQDVKFLPLNAELNVRKIYKSLPKRIGTNRADADDDDEDELTSLVSQTMTLSNKSGGFFFTCFLFVTITSQN